MPAPAPAAPAYTRKQLGAAAPAVLAMAFPAYSTAALRDMLDLQAGDVPAALDMLAQLEGTEAGEPGGGGDLVRQPDPCFGDLVVPLPMPHGTQPHWDAAGCPVWGRACAGL